MSPMYIRADDIPDALGIISKCTLADNVIGLLFKGVNGPIVLYLT